MRIAIGADHRGFLIKSFLVDKKMIGPFAISWVDVGTMSMERTDYPKFAKKVVHLLSEGSVDLGIMACGSGIGMAVAANRCTAIYAGVAWNADIARKAKEDDNVNILVLPADYVDLEEGYTILLSWLSATFKKGRYEERLIQIDEDRMCG